ncbi:MAG: hypothetical protein COU11_03100 [Candidatus Harrisonbacteria bacterium CG10_big_fil_rev_8_21_14_0_10_49_15]|uniref:Uncharacterized protein n=1 Tax=Candidatus Harrisonbacteria bacterium CG10_big_fil_rev_8_21_14_0_10_49_15 TaxID=1974587 RepID=A0A2H0UKP2_9BACT|nr:MAG: hypothetical protein COU11_03100 [Candidatus Harrisonbacteria bacterium CG10_big_fil_rev_8_21_14_0_10_49_15]
MITAKQLAKTLLQMSEEEVDRQKVMQQFFAFMERYHLEGLLPNVAGELESAERERILAVALHITTAHPLTPAEEANIRMSIGAKDAPLIATLDKELFGGFRARYRGMEYEGSLGHTAGKLEKKLMEE